MKRAVDPFSRTEGASSDDETTEADDAPLFSEEGASRLGPSLSKREREALADRYYGSASGGDASTGREAQSHPVDPKIAQLPPDGTILQPGWSVHVKGDPLSASFNEGGDLLALACRDGSVRVLKAESGLQLYELPPLHAHGGPVASTAVRFLKGAGGTSNVALVARGGVVQHIHVTSGQVVAAHEEPGNGVNCLGLRADGLVYATGGTDRHIRVWDAHRQAMICDMVGGPAGDDAPTCGHSNTVFGVCFDPTAPHVVVSGGWDSTVQVWDTREGHAVRSLGGPLVCGDSLDILGHTLLAGSWRARDHLELFDLRTGGLMTTLPSLGGPQDEAKVYTARFGPGGTVVAGCTGRRPLVRVLQVSGRPVSTTLMSCGVVSLDVFPRGDFGAVGGEMCTMATGPRGGQKA